MFDPFEPTSPGTGHQSFPVWPSTRLYFARDRDPGMLQSSYVMTPGLFGLIVCHCFHSLEKSL